MTKKSSKMSVTAVLLLLFSLSSILGVECCQANSYKPINPSDNSITTAAPAVVTTTASPTVPSSTTSGRILTCGSSRVYLNETEGGRVVGGTTAKPNEFPWLVRLLISNDNSDVVLCGASIINERWLLTAAHCVRNAIGPNGITAIFSDWDIDAMDSGEFSMTMASIVIHPNYNNPTRRDNDFALLLLSRPIDISTMNVQRICLPATCDDGCFNIGTLVDIAGWGTTSEGGDTPSRYLQRATIEIVNQANCRSNYNTIQIPISENMLCAGMPDGSADTCQGDSGGPLMLLQGDHFTLCGVTSFGHGCANPNFPGVYARICMVVDWIRAVAGVAN